MTVIDNDSGRVVPVPAQPKRKRGYARGRASAPHPRVVATQQLLGALDKGIEVVERFGPGVLLSAGAFALWVAMQRNRRE